MRNKITYQDIIKIYKEFEVPLHLLEREVLSEIDAKALCDKITELQPENILAVCSPVGVSTLLMAAYSPNPAKIYTVIPKSFSKSQLEHEDDLYNGRLSITLPVLNIQAAARAGVAHKIIWNNSFSDNLPLTLTNNNSSFEVCGTIHEICEKYGPFDFIFIDWLNHTDALLSGLELAVKYLKPGGVIAFDNTFSTYWGPIVRRAIFRFMDSRSDFILFHDRDWDSLSDIAFLQHFPQRTNSYSINDTYNKEFYERCIKMHSKTVPTIAQLIHRSYQPKSVIDFGCGAGLWLEEFIKLGVNDVKGIDGSCAVIGGENKKISDMITIHDLRQKYITEKKYDICLCLDVIEHIEPEYENNLIWSCVNASDTIIFSSPPPGQGGDGHVNERPVSHWVEKFYDYGYVLFDEIRPPLEGMTHLPETTYQLNLYVIKRVFSPDSVRTHALDYLLNILKEKESRIEDLFLQNLFARKRIESEVGKLENLEEVLKQIQMVDFKIPKERILKEKGFCYTFNFKTSAGKMFSHLPYYKNSSMYEDGRPLTSGNASHDNIRNLGKGMYSMWHSQIYFASSDNSDPRTNGYVYSIRVPSYVYVLEILPEEQIRKLAL